MMKIRHSVQSVMDRRWVALSSGESRFTLLDYDRDVIVFDAVLPGDCRYHFDVSPDGRVLVTGYVTGPMYAIDLWDVQTCERLAKSRKTPVDVVFGPTGEHVVVRPTKGPTYLWHYRTGKTILLPWAESGRNGIRDSERGEFLIPTVNRKREAVLVRWEPVRVLNVELPVDGVIWRIQRSPKGDAAVVIDNHDSVYGLSYPGRELHWKQPVEGLDWVCFSRDGNSIAVSIQVKYRSFKIVVLDADTGRILRTITHKSRAEHPFEGSQVLSATGELVDLHTGCVSPGFSDLKWWRSRMTAKPRVLT